MEGKRCPTTNARKIAGTKRERGDRIPSLAERQLAVGWFAYTVPLTSQAATTGEDPLGLRATAGRVLAFR
jgi:hypothetical protein